MYLNAVYYGWDMQEGVCPCDLHLNDWIAERGIADSVIYHFGTGLHHAVGIEQATNDSGNLVLAITASPEEHAAYVDRVSERASIAKRYMAYFGDIYLTDPRLLPELDVVTMFHLCEFTEWNTATTEYGGRTDRMLLDLFTDRIRAGGHILFYPGSLAWSQTQQLLGDWETQKPVECMGRYKSLLVYRKRG